jgi:hypothetical protein
MAERSTPNLVVYRDGRTRLSARALIRQLESALADLWPQATSEALLGALLRAGELECALSDVNSHDATLAASISDELANVLCRERWTSAFDSSSTRKAQQHAAAIRYDGELTVSRPEGFAYYALHPLDFADMVSAASLRAPCVHVVGIRSIGTTLSAVVAAELNAEGISATRTTVRPEGHPYDRRTIFSGTQRNALQQALSRGALFLVCDEGPGRSGSSLLSVAEALEAEGVPCDCVVLLCSHQPDVSSLCSPNATQRWRRYRSLATGITKRLPQEADQYLDADEWRKLLIAEGDAWPAAWPNTERLKFLSRDRQKLFKFEGHGHYGEQVGAREQLLSVSGFGTSYLGHQSGFGIYELVRGSQPGITDVSPALLSHMASYCAWRADTLATSVSEEGARQLESMAAANVEGEFGFAPKMHLELQRPAICDSRMQPYEWRRVGDEHWIKLDASTHGDDHFFPGPTDIAWDLAGICVEWQLSAACREFFLAEYQRLSGDNPARRVAQYEIAYTAFRLDWSRMAAGSVPGTADEARLLQDANRYRAILDRVLVTSATSR